MDDAVGYLTALDDLTEFWSQRTLAEANGTLIKVAKGTGSTEWHAHDDQDETFLVVDGRLTIHLRDPEERSVEVGPGELFVVAKGVEHRPAADGVARFVILGTTVTSTRAGGKPEWSFAGGDTD